MRFLFFLICFPAMAQNLVLNPSFEQSKRCVYGIGQFSSFVTDWSTPTFASTDYFNSCTKGEASVPANFIGIQTPKEGASYAGFYLFTEKNYREYVQGKLASTLEKDKKYVISFWISLSEASDYALNDIGVLLTQNKVNALTDRPLSPKELSKGGAGDFHLYPIVSKLYYNDKQNWMRLRTTITATGSENYLVIGNFKTNGRTDKELAAPKRLEIAYYFIDQVSVEPADPEEASSAPVKTTDFAEPEPFAGPPEIGKSYILNNVNFAFDSADLTETSKTELNRLYDYLGGIGRPKISVSGHTDDIGNDAYNQEISHRRAQSVANYLIEKGYEANLIEASGYGESSPIVPNDTEENRLKNRRVEFRILQ